MKKGLFTLIIFTLLMINISSKVHADTEKKVVYFYVTTCSVCAKTGPYVDRLEQYGITVEKYDMTKYGDLFYDYMETFHVEESKQTTPILFVGDTYFHGEEIIPNIENNTILGLADSDMKELIEGNVKDFSLFALIYFALVDGVNPCAMAMLLLFISLLGFTSKRSTLIKVSLSYIFALFLSYFLLGTVLYNVLYKLKDSPFITVFNILILILSLILFAFNLHDFIVTKNEKYEKVKLQLPKGIQKYNKKIMKYFTKKFEEDSPLIYIITFALGFIISLTEFLCTGQVYLAFITSMIHFSDVFSLTSVLYLLLYNFIFVLPLVAVAVVAIVSKSIMGTSDFIRKRMHLIKLLNALLFLVIALYYLNYFFNFMDTITKFISLGQIVLIALLILIISFIITFRKGEKKIE